MKSFKPSNRSPFTANVGLTSHTVAKAKAKTFEERLQAQLDAPAFVNTMYRK